MQQKPDFLNADCGKFAWRQRLGEGAGQLQWQDAIDELRVMRDRASDDVVVTTARLVLPGLSLKSNFSISGLNRLPFSSSIGIVFRRCLSGIPIVIFFSPMSMSMSMAPTSFTLTRRKHRYHGTDSNKSKETQRNNWHQRTIWDTLARMPKYFACLVVSLE